VNRTWQWMFRLVAALSFFLMLTTVAIWRRGYSTWDHFEWRNELRWISVDATWGSIEIESGPGDDGLSVKSEYKSRAPIRNLGADDYEFWDWHAGADKFGVAGMKEGNVRAEFPFYVLVIGLAILPTSWIWWKRKHRRTSGRCVACGYDVEGSSVKKPAAIL
jgi:hypothetical protein